MTSMSLRDRFSWTTKISRSMTRSTWPTSCLHGRSRSRAELLVGFQARARIGALDGFAESLGGDRAGLNADAADHLLLFDHGDFFS